MDRNAPRPHVPRTRIEDFLRRYNFVFCEVGLILSLVIVVGAFSVDIQLDERFEIAEFVPTVVELENIEQTEHIERPPPPPRPSPPVVVPNDEILEDEILDIDAEIDIFALADIPTPPPPDPYEANEEPEIFVVVEEMPVMIGGMARLRELIKYPELAVKAGIEGQVIVQFVVETDGRTTNAVVMRSGGALLDGAALAAVSKLEFEPGKQRGVPVRVRFALPVRFSLTSRPGV